MGSQMWFGTEGRSRWIPTPASGAEATPEGWGASGVLLNGGGFVAQSFASHKTYNYSWSNASSRQAAQMMQSYRDGTYGRGLLYFVEPTIYDTNILPKHWADPSMALDGEAPAFIRTVNPTLTAWATTTPDVNDLPSTSVQYAAESFDDYQGYPGAANSLYVPVPPGFVLQIGAFYSASGDGGVFASHANGHGGVTDSTKLTATPNDATGTIMRNTITGGSNNGVRLWVGRLGSASSTVRVTALIARLIPEARKDVVSDAQRGPWIGGQGHSGCRFDGNPTYVTHNGVGGGQVGYAATFRETGSWEY